MSLPAPSMRQASGGFLMRAAALDDEEEDDEIRSLAERVARLKKRKPGAQGGAGPRPDTLKRFDTV